MTQPPEPTYNNREEIIKKIVSTHGVENLKEVLGDDLGSLLYQLIYYKTQ